MKKILAILMCLFALTAQATETVTILYSWSPADVAANFHRVIAEQANKIQNKYNFVLDTKSGAGGAIAAQHVLNNPDNTILASSSAFFIRPIFFPDSYDPAKFKEILPVCSAPLVVSSKKFKSFAEVPTNQPLTIAVSGLGITTHLVAVQVTKKYPNIKVVPFKSTTDSVASVVQGSVDFAVSFGGDVSQYAESDKVHLYVLGVTGKQRVLGAPTLTSLGFSPVVSEMSAPSNELVPVTWSDEKYNEVRAILLKASQTKEAKAAYSEDFCAPITADPVKWFNSQSTLWKSVTEGVSIK
jgi:tripartite-type tricarboxylate transporter receptor subunit TctC